MLLNALNSNWFRVDNAANLYAANIFKDWNRTFRSAVIIDENVKPEILQKALEDTVKRFPSFSVKIKQGLFWSYFEKTEAAPVVVKDEYMPYRSIQLEGTDRPAFRVSYYKNRIAMETFHSVTDGAGNTVFFSSLLARYFELQGETINHTFSRSVHDQPKESEVCDEYVKRAVPGVKAKVLSSAPSYLNENNAEKDFALVISGLFRIEELKAAAKKYGLTVNEYFVANLIYMFIQCDENPIEKDIRVSVPINLRKYFPTDNVRNFTYMESIDFNPHGRRDVSFEEICESIRGQLAGKSSKNELLNQISGNVAAQNRLITSIVPYPIKKIFLRNSYKKSQNSYTTFLSNMGVVDHSPEVNRHIVRSESALGCNPHMHFGCTASTANGIVNFTFCCGNHNVEKQKAFFRHIASDGVNVRVESNIHK